MKNKIYEKDRVILGEKIPLNSPISIFIDISEKCNMKCIYCFRSNTTEKNESYVWRNDLMKMDIFLSVLNQIQEFKVVPRKISLSGHGEPLMNKNLAEMVKLIKERFPNTVVEIHTNGILFSKKISRNILNSNIDKINISLQGLDSGTYKKISNVNINYDDFVENIEFLYKNRGKTEINVQILDIALQNDGIEKLYKLFGNITNTISINKEVPIWDNLNNNMNFNSNTTNKYGEYIPYQKSCSLLFYTIFIAPNGDIFPCTEPSINFNLGNIKKTTLLKAWNSKEREEFLYKHIFEGRSTIDCCNKCYVAQNSIMTEADSLNNYLEIIKERLIRKREKND